MSRLEGRFAERRAAGRSALVPYITAGDPSPEVTVGLMHALVEGGADIIELGVPFSDPMADGPVIQAAFERALAHHVRLRDVLDLVRAFRRHDTDTPVVLMGYLNPIEALGYAAFARAAHEAGVDGVLTVDLPPEEAHELLEVLMGQGIDPVFLIAPTTSAERMRQVCAASRGFVYYVSLKGVTGAGGLDTDAVAAKVAELREATGLPVGVGFGVRDADSAAKVGGFADAVIVGSALVRVIAEHANDPARLREAARDFIAELRGAMDASAVSPDRVSS